jgi:hypothetical protein
MRQALVHLAVVLSLGITPGGAAVDSGNGSKVKGYATGDLDEWQRIDFRPTRMFLRKAPEIRVAIETRGPSMQGLIRIPGGLASNFDTGRGLTVVDLINPGDETRGYAEIVALEIAFTQSAPGQVFRVFAAED